jgi:hypothetical protein
MSLPTRPRNPLRPVSFIGCYQTSSIAAEALQFGLLEGSQNERVILELADQPQIQCRRTWPIFDGNGLVEGRARL